MKSIITLIGLLLWFMHSSAQHFDRLEQKVKQAQTDKEKIYALDSLAKYYTFFYEGDSAKVAFANEYGDQQIAIAQKSRDRELLTLAYLLNGLRLSEYNYYALFIARADTFLQQTIRLAQQYNLPYYKACAALQLSVVNVSLYHLNIDRANQFANLAQNMAAALSNDSLRVLATLAMGSVQKAWSNQVAAFRNYAEALRGAERLRSVFLMMRANRALARFYFVAGDNEKAISYAVTALTQSKQLHNSLETIYSYEFLINQLCYTAHRYADARAYCIELNHLPAMIHQQDMYSLSVQWFIYYSYIGEKRYQQARDYYTAHPEIAAGVEDINGTYFATAVKAMAFRMEGKIDSAAHYFQQAVTMAAQAHEQGTAAIVYKEYGNLLLEQKQIQRAIGMFQKSQAILETLPASNEQAEVYHQLEVAYAQLGKTKEAYSNRLLYDQFRDSIQKLSDQKQLALLEVDNENKRLLNQQQLEEDRERRRHYLQYMGITAGIALVFIVLVLLGFFSTSTAVIRGLGFFAFIFFFEFIILLADHQIHTWTHGEPWKVLAIKIGLIALLLPLHHYLEESVVHYLVHHKKIKLQQWGRRRKKTLTSAKE